MMASDFLYDLPLKVNWKVNGRNYEKRLIFPLPFKLDYLDVLQTYSKSGSRNALNATDGIRFVLQPCIQMLTITSR